MKERPESAEPTSYERTVLKNFSEFHYLKIQLVFQDKVVKLSAAQLKSFILSALKDLHGEVGASCPLDLLKYDGQTLCAILRVKSSGLVKLWTSLTLVGQYQGHQCSIRVIQSFPNQHGPTGISFCTCADPDLKKAVDDKGGRHPSQSLEYGLCKRRKRWTLLNGIYTHLYIRHPLFSWRWLVTAENLYWTRYF